LSDPFADIRPYRDEEVPAVLDRLLADRELLDAIARLSLGRVARLLPGLARPVVRWYLGRQLRGVQDDALPYADVRGVSKVFRDHAIDIRNCMDREGPEAYAGEQTVAIQLTLHLNGEEAYVASVDALGEHQSRYAAFGGCVTELLSATRFQGQASPEKKVNWTVRR